MKITVVIPVYNEEICLERTICEVADFFEMHKNLIPEIIVVDDCSTDNTFEIGKSLKLKYNFLRFLRNDKNMGKGFSVREGVAQSTGDLFLFMDADSSTKIGEINKLLSQFDVGYDIAIGSRGMAKSVILRHQHWLKESIARLGNKVIRLFLDLPFVDTQCGFKLFSNKAKIIFRRQTIWRWGFDFELLYLAKKYGFKVAEVPIIWENDPSSAVRRIDYLIVLFDVFKIRLNDWLGKYNNLC